MSEVQRPVQLSFDVGGSPPDLALLRLSGAQSLERELRKGDEVHLALSDADGNVIASGYGRVVGVAFRDRTDHEGFVVGTERIHTVKLE